jgi:hypothetical protein
MKTFLSRLFLTCTSEISLASYTSMFSPLNQWNGMWYIDPAVETSLFMMQDLCHLLTIDMTLRLNCPLHWTFKIIYFVTVIVVA